MAVLVPVVLPTFPVNHCNTPGALSLRTFCVHHPQFSRWFDSKACSLPCMFPIGTPSIASPHWLLHVSSPHIRSFYNSYPDHFFFGTYPWWCWGVKPPWYLHCSVLSLIPSSWALIACTCPRPPRCGTHPCLGGVWGAGRGRSCGPLRSLQEQVASQHLAPPVTAVRAALYKEW